MEASELIATLKAYVEELNAFLGRFTLGVEGLHMHQGDRARYNQIVIEVGDLFDREFEQEVGTRYRAMIGTAYRESVRNYIGLPSHNGLENVRAVLSAALTFVQRNPTFVKPARNTQSVREGEGEEIILKLADRFHHVVCQLRRRHNGAATLDVADEYDVQDLLHALLTIHFADIRPE